MVPGFGGPTGQRARQEGKPVVHVLRPSGVWVLDQVLCLGKLESVLPLQSQFTPCLAIGRIQNPTHHIKDGHCRVQS